MITSVLYSSPLSNLECCMAIDTGLCMTKKAIAKRGKVCKKAIEKCF